MKLVYERNRVRIKTDNMQLFDSLRQRFTTPNKSYKYQPHGSRFISAITPLGSFHVGMTFDIVKAVKSIDPNLKVDIEPTLKRKIVPHQSKHPLIDVPNTEFQYRDYQANSVNLAMKHGRGIILLPTSSGKSLIIAGMCINMSELKNVLILVPNIQLVKQMYKDFLEYGISKDEVQMFSGFDKTLGNQRIIISNRQYLEKGHYTEIPEPDMVIVDEIHQCKKTNKVSKYVNKLQTDIRFGLTGTLPDDTEDVWHIKGIIGPVFISKEIVELQDRGFLANINIVPIKFNHINKPTFNYTTYDEIKKAFHTEYHHIESVENSNKMICKIANKLKGNTLLLFDHIVHGETLYELLDHEHKYLVDGRTEIDFREDIREHMEKENDIITIANSKCFGTGISIKNISNIIFVMHGKGVTKIIQALGRGLRLREGKTKLNLIDIYHNFKYSMKHFEHRCKLYDKFYDKKVDSVKTVDIIS